MVRAQMWRDAEPGTAPATCGPPRCAPPTTSARSPTPRRTPGRGSSTPLARRQGGAAGRRGRPAAQLDLPARLRARARRRRRDARRLGARVARADRGAADVPRARRAVRARPARPRPGSGRCPRPCVRALGLVSPLLREVAAVADHFSRAVRHGHDRVVADARSRRDPVGPRDRRDARPPRPASRERRPGRRRPSAARAARRPRPRGPRASARRRRAARRGSSVRIPANRRGTSGATSPPTTACRTSTPRWDSCTTSVATACAFAVTSASRVGRPLVGGLEDRRCVDAPGQRARVPAQHLRELVDRAQLHGLP